MYRRHLKVKTTGIYQYNTAGNTKILEKEIIAAAGKRLQAGTWKKPGTALATTLNNTQKPNQSQAWVERGLL